MLHMPRIALIKKIRHEFISTVVNDAMAGENRDKREQQL
jgi:hypothetical protein